MKLADIYLFLYICCQQMELRLNCFLTTENKGSYYVMRKEGWPKEIS